MTTILALAAELDRADADFGRAESALFGEASSGTSGGLQAEADRLHDLISDIEERIALAPPQCDGDAAALSVLLLSYLDSLSYSPALLAPTADPIEGRVYALAARLAEFLVERTGGLAALGMEGRFGDLFRSAGPVPIGEPLACGAASCPS